MFTIQYKPSDGRDGAKIWDIPKSRLYGYILSSEQDIEAIYELSTPVTQRVRKELAEAMERGSVKHATAAARRFISSHQ